MTWALLVLPVLAVFQVFRLAANRRATREAIVASLRRDLAACDRQLHQERASRQLAEQARDFYKVQATTWERRAVKFIDQVAIRNDMLSSPAMTTPAPPAPSPAQDLMARINRSALTPTATEPVPTTVPTILGVDDDAAARAVAAVFP